MTITISWWVTPIAITVLSLVCGSCTHVDEKWGWRHEPRTLLNDPQHYAGGPDDR